MCLIIYAPKGYSKQDPFLKEAIIKAAEFNTDGIGYAIKRPDNSLYLDRGFKDTDVLFEYIEEQKLTDDDEFMIHLRIGNKGAVTNDMCHPFLVSSDHQEIITTNETLVDKPVVAHNGTMIKHSVLNSKYSDTYFFIKNVLSKPSVLNFLKEDATVFDEIMQPHINLSRLLVMFPDETPTTFIGKWYTESGLLFSKDYFYEYFPKVNTGFHYRGNNNFDDWGDDYARYQGAYDDFQENIRVNDKAVKKIKDNLANVIHIPDEGNRESLEDFLSTSFVLYMGLFLTRSDLSTRLYYPEPTSGNLEDIDIVVIKEWAKHSIWRGYRYYIKEVTDTDIEIACINTLATERIKKNVFYKYFMVNISQVAREKYDIYHELIKLFPVSKNLYKRMKKVISIAISKGSETFNFKGIKDIPVSIGNKFLYNLNVELDYKANPQNLLF